MDKFDVKIMAAYLVLKAAAEGEPAAPVSDIGRWWENYNKPFLESWKQMRGDPEKNIKGDIGGAASNLWQKRPGTLLGLLGAIFGSTMGPKWAAGLGALGLGAGAIWGRRGEIQPYIQKTFVKPALDEAQARFRAELDPLKARADKWEKWAEQNQGAFNLANTLGNWLPKSRPAPISVSAAPKAESLKPAVVSGT